MAKKGKKAAVEVEDDAVDFTEGDSLIVNLSEVESGFDVMPRGMYNCVVEELEFGYSQSAGNPMWTWGLEVEDGEFAGRKLFFHTVWKGDGLGITKQTIKRVKPELFDTNIDPEAIAAEGDMVGLRVRARVKIKKYEGEDRNNVSGLYAAVDEVDNFDE